MKQMPKSRAKCTHICILPFLHGITHYSFHDKTHVLIPPVFTCRGSTAINRPTAPDVPLCQNLRQTLRFLEAVLLNILSFR